MAVAYLQTRTMRLGVCAIRSADRYRRFVVALVGRSGSGKTTAMSLIMRLQEVSAGRILLDGVDVRRYSLNSLRRRVAVVLQDHTGLLGKRQGQHPLRPPGRVGRPDRSRARRRRARLHHGAPIGLRHAARRSGLRSLRRAEAAHQHRSRVPQGRTDPDLDEPTAALDNVTEAAIFESLRRLRAGRTTFVIAHRLSTCEARIASRFWIAAASWRLAATTSWCARARCRRDWPSSSAWSDRPPWRKRASSGYLYSVYVRGLAYLAAQQLAKAAKKFQKILAQRGLVLGDPINAMARLQPARALTLSGDSVKAKGAYQDFLSLWKAAGPDASLVSKVNAEYARLH